MAEETARPTPSQWEEIHQRLDRLEESVKRQNETVQRSVSENPDSLTLGAPTNGQIKVYGDFSKPDEFKAKIEAAKRLLAEAKGE